MTLDLPVSANHDRCDSLRNPETRCHENGKGVLRSKLRRKDISSRSPSPAKRYGSKVIFFQCPGSPIGRGTALRALTVAVRICLGTQSRKVLEADRYQINTSRRSLLSVDVEITEQSGRTMS